MAVVVCAVILAVTAVTTVTVDLGPALRTQAEEQGSRFLKRPMRIGRLSVRLWRGRFIVEDLVIDGLKPESRPFLTAKRIAVSMPWSTLFNQRIVFDEIEMTDWIMYVESHEGGVHNFPDFTPDTPRGQSNWTTTLQYVRAHRGEFVLDDFGSDWAVVAPNLDVTVGRPGTEYGGQARFSDGLVTIGDFVPMRTDMTMAFKIDGGTMLFDRIDLTSDGARSVVTGVADLGRWPEMTYQVKSRMHFPRMREIFFADDPFTLHGDGEFTGSWHLFKGGRELKGTFSSPVFGVNDLRFARLRGSVLWLPKSLEVTDASADLYGGTSRFSYRMAPLGADGVPTIAIFDAEYADVDLAAFGDFLEIQGIRLAGRATGRHLLEWPLGRFADRRGDGSVRAEPPAGSTLMTRGMPANAATEDEQRTATEGPFSNHLPSERVALGGEVTYAYGPDWIDLAPSHAATPTTFVSFEGRTAYGDESTIPFHVTSGDWQESDRLLAGLLTAFGSPTKAIPIGGYGTFDGVMTDTFRRPRIEGTFAGERMRAFNVVWGSARGSAVIQNNYADVKDIVILTGDSAIHADGRFSLGYPRRDRGEEINARIRLTRRPLADVRDAFALYDYPVEGLLSGEYHVYGAYENPYGFGRMTIENGVAYGEPFNVATSGLRFEGAGVRLDDIEIRKGTGRGVGAAYVGFDGTYSFNLDGRSIPLEDVAVAANSRLPLTGLLDFSAGGSGTFEVPSYDVRGSLRDVFVDNEGLGQVAGEIGIRGDVLTLKVEAGSPRLAVSGSGRVALTADMEADVSFRVSDTSLDPYVRTFQPRLSPFTTAIASGQVRVVGPLADRERLVVTADVERLDLRFFDYQLRNAAPIRISLDRQVVRVTEMRLAGDDTSLDLTGTLNVPDERLAMKANGTANLGILQGFFRNVRGSGRATVTTSIDGPMRNPVVSGTLTVDNGRIRHFAAPHALESINGVVDLDSRGLRLDGVTARLGGGDVAFRGRVQIDGYRTGPLDIGMSGRNMRLRFPAGMSSLVDADLTLTGTPEAATLGGNVLVRNAVYTRRFDTSVLNLAGGGAPDPVGEPASSQPAIPLRFDVRVSAPSTLRVDNNIIDAVATADLQLGGTYDRPLLFGRAEIDRGTVLFEGKRYVISRGTIDFNNPTRIEPFFDVEAQTRVRVPRQTYEVTVRAAGVFERFTPEFTADPPLAEMEVLALLLGDVAPGQDVEFSQYNTSITPQQQLLRERAARALTGSLSSGVGRVVEQTFGVDTFQLTPSLGELYEQTSRVAPGARLTIGKRISDRVFLTYSRSLVTTTRDQIILLEYDQSDRFSWVLSQNEDDTYALDVRVRHVF